jgi:hypothetical protein
MGSVRVIIIILKNEMPVNSIRTSRPPLWSSGQFLATDSEAPGTIPGATRIFGSSGSGTVSIQSREDN